MIPFALDLLNSTGLQTVVALVAGAFIFVQYKLNKRDEIKNAASLIVTEIQSADRKINSLKKRLDEGVLESDVSIIPSNSWAQYRHLLSRFLDRDEWDSIEEFYDKTLMIDDTIKYNRQMFRNDVEQIRVNKQRAVADFAIETVNDIGQGADRTQVANIFSSKVQVYDTLYMSKQGELLYSPNRIVEDAKKFVGNLPKILNTTAMAKLKSVAKNGR